MNSRASAVFFMFLFLWHGASCAAAVQQQITTSVPEWSNLKVTWGPDPQNPNIFAELPRTTEDALRNGFVKINDCDVNAPWRGSRFVKGGDYAVILLFDINGYIAGIQTAVAKGLPDGYPSRYLRPPFVDDGSRYVISAYFVDPAIICSRGRTAYQFKFEGTGSNLYIQNSTVPEESFLVPKDEVYIGFTPWTQGKCVPTMGNHYWYNISKYSRCDQIFPVFLLYNSFKLNAFGWALTSYLESPRFEHPKSEVFGLFVKEVPICLKELEAITTMHIFFSNPLTNEC